MNGVQDSAMAWEPVSFKELMREIVAELRIEARADSPMLGMIQYWMRTFGPIVRPIGAEAMESHMAGTQDSAMEPADG